MQSHAQMGHMVTKEDWADLSSVCYAHEASTATKKEQNPKAYPSQWVFVVCPLPNQPLSFIL